MKKKGFTLIELLAVIVILAVIALIATPAVLNIIEDSKKSAAEASARSIASAAKTYYLKTIMDKGTIGEIDLSTDTLKYDGDKAKKGVLSYDAKGNVVGKMYISGYCIEVKSDGSIVSNKVDENDCSIPKSTDLSCFTIEGTTITAYKCYERNEDGLPTIKDVVIPSGITKIGAAAFNRKGLTSVVIPSGVTEIGRQAFMDNQLTNVVIPNSVTKIERLAFFANKIADVTIPNSVIEIGGGAFNFNSLPNNLAYIYKRLDANNDGIAEIDTTTLVSYGGNEKNVEIPNGVKTIGDHAFTSCQVDSIEIPDSVTTIGNSVFTMSTLTSITIPNSVTTIGDTAFEYSSLEEISIDSMLGVIPGSPWGADSKAIKYLR